MDLSRNTSGIQRTYSIPTVIGLSLLTCAFVAHAKRLPPPTVASVSAGGVEYSAPHSLSYSGQNGGFIVAKGQKNQQVLWRKKIYNINYNKDLEKDVQDVYITTLRLKGKTLVIHDEKSRTFCLNTMTQLVTHCG